MTAKKTEDLTQIERNVLEMLREHPRSVDTIAWGVGVYTSDMPTNANVLLALESLEAKGLAQEAQISDDNWWWKIKDT